MIMFCVLLLDKLESPRNICHLYLLDTGMHLDEEVAHHVVVDEIFLVHFAGTILSFLENPVQIMFFHPTNVV